MNAANEKESAILSRLIEPENGNWSKDAAESILKLSFPTSDTNRMNVLAAKARLGSLSPDEQMETEIYMRAGRLVELLQSKARISLKQNAA
jgi:hypothetical protein